MTYLEMTPTPISPAGLKDVSPGVIFAPLSLIEDEAADAAIDALTVKMAGFALADVPDQDLCETPEEPLAFPAAPGSVYTGRLRGLIPVFIAQLFAMFSRAHVQGGAVSRLWELRGLIYALYKTEKENYVRAATHALQNNPVWQSQVREDLGGEAVLTRWEARYARLQNGEEVFSPMAAKTKHRPAGQAAGAASKPTQPLTDRHGMFRLAILTLAPGGGGRITGSSSGALGLPRERCVHIIFRPPRAIGLTPDQLRPCAASMAGGIITYEQLYDIWTAMESEHSGWVYLLVLADLMTVSESARADLAPP